MEDASSRAQPTEASPAQKASPPCREEDCHSSASAFFCVVEVIGSGTW